MIKVRLSRQGKKNSPFYKIVAIEGHRKRDGKYLETLGYYKPSKDELEIDKEKLQKWIKNGAQVSDAVKNLIKDK
ncbi:30S ribosomal protein S16 [Candidatus Woesebacteria bacterium]|nr:30S ribosomal protein S16 [Candidatus Woesebacteria bacterium]